MPRQPGLIGAAAALLLALSGAAVAQSCGPVVEADAEDGVLDLHMRFPCAPYQTLDIRYGPLHLAEETGAQGAVRVSLPVLDLDVPMTAEIGGETLQVGIPDDAEPGGFLWIEPDTLQPGLLPVAGFPVSPQPLPELAAYGKAPAPEHLDLKITPENCGRTLSFGLLRSGWPAPRPVTLDLPGCGMVGTILRLPVPAE